MRYVIIGGSAAGVSCAQALRKNIKGAEIIVISDEKFPLYSRCLLTYLIAGGLGEEELNFKDLNFYRQNNIKTFLGKRAAFLDVKKKIVTLADDTMVAYDKLLLATGASAKKVNIPGADKKGVFTVRRIDDARLILEELEEVQQVTVLGGGLIGLRDAYALSQRKKQVTVVVKSPQILSQMVDSQAARIIGYILEKNGIKIVTGSDAKEIIGKQHVEAVLLDNGQRLQSQMVIVGKGVNANTELAKLSGLAVDQAIVVDDFLRTSEKDIYAAGDCAQTYDLARGQTRVNALWPCAVEQGEIAALNMLDKEVRYPGSLSMNSVEFFGLPCISMGITRSESKDDYEILNREAQGLYQKLILKEDIIVGAIFIGQTKSAGIISALIKNKIDISAIKHFLLDDNFDYAKIIPLIAQNKDKFKLKEFQETIITY